MCRVQHYKSQNDHEHNINIYGLKIAFHEISYEESRKKGKGSMVMCNYFTDILFLKVMGVFLIWTSHSEIR